MHRPNKKYRFDWRQNNQYTLLIDGDIFFERIVSAIKHAKNFVLLETYLIASGQVVDQLLESLKEAIARGVKIFLLLDDFGARQLANADREILQEMGVNLLFYNPVKYHKWFSNLQRNHRKLTLIDGQRAFVGGAGFTDEFSPTISGRQYWRDVMLEIRGPVLQDWQTLFQQTWHDCGGYMPIYDAADTAPASGFPGRVITSSGLGRQEINRSLLRQLRQARTRIWITTPYFVTSWKIRRALRRAARNRHDVRLLLPGPQTDHPWVRHAARAYFGRLLHNGVRIFEFQPGFSHAKIMLCDDWVSIGSSNLDRWDQFWNLDANQELSSAVFAQELSRYFNDRMLESRELTFSEWLERPRRTRLKEWFASRFVLWLDRISHRSGTSD